MTQTDTERFIRALEESLMTKEEKAERLGRQIGDVIATLIVFFGVITIIWAVLNFIFLLNISWLKIFGGFLIFNLIKNIIIKPFLKK